MWEKKWTLDVESNQYDLLQGKFYLIGCVNEEENSKNCVDIRIKSESVDTRHCLLDISDEALYIYDLHSKHGTFLNDKRLDSMLKERVSAKAVLRFGEVKAQLYFKENINSIEHSSTDTFLAPSRRAPRTSFSNTSTRLFSSPDVSLIGDNRDESFYIPDTQHIKRVSMGNLDMLSTSGNQSNDSKSIEDESFIPETQSPTTTEQEPHMHKSSEMIRICTQDFNENLFEHGDDDDMFSSLVVPNIKHDPVIWMRSPINDHLNKDVSKDSGKRDEEMETLNWATQTSKNATSSDTTLNSECVERYDVCTPDLFGLPEFAQINMPVTTEGTNINFDERDEVKSQERASNKTTSPVDQVLRIDDKVSGGDGYAEEIELMPTQVFIPVAQKPESQLKENAAITGAELSLSGKENIPCTDLSVEQTERFLPVKDGNAVESKCNSISVDVKEPSTNESSDRNISLLPPTQVFKGNLPNSAREPKKINQTEKGDSITAQQKLKFTLASIGDSESSKSAASFFEEMALTSKKAETKEKKVSEKTRSGFKKPKQSTTSSRSSSRAHEKHSRSNSSQSELEDLHLCTPKWIIDNFDELSVDQNVSSVKKRMLFGSDSEEESLELNKMTTKKDSKDFEKLLSNIEYAKPAEKLAQSKNSAVVQNSYTEIRNLKNIKTTITNRNDVALIIEKSDVKKTEKVEAIKKGQKRQKSKKFDEKESKPSNKSTEAKEKGIGIKVIEEHEKIKTDSKHEEIKCSKNGTSKDLEHPGAGLPSKRMTRLRSRASDLDVENASSSSGPSQAKKNKIEHIDESETNKKRLTRSRSKTESQESIASTKSTGSSRSKRKNAREDSAQSKIDYCSDKNSAKASKHTQANESKEPGSTSSDRNCKRRVDGSSDDETKHLKSSTRTLQVAMTMVEPKLFQSLVENSPGNWGVASVPTDADVLVMDKGNRTLKFLIAMAKGIPIVTSKWLALLNSTKTVPRGVTHFFRDQEFEKRHRFSLFKSLELARKSKLFKGYDFLTTPGILPQPAEMKQIIECAGGKVHIEPPPPEQNQTIFLISTSHDKKYWHKYRRCNSNLRITDSEGVMASVMRQTTQPLVSNIFA